MKTLNTKNNKKGFANLVLIGVIVVLVTIVGYFALVKKSIPAEQQTSVPTPAQSDTNLEQMQGIVVQQPIINQEVQLPITVKGYINGNDWGAFEGVAGSVQVFDANNKAISQMVSLQTTTDWMKFPAYFEATVGDRQIMSNLETKTGTLVFKSEEEKDGSIAKEFRLPVKFVNNQTSNWKTYKNDAYGFAFDYPSALSATLVDHVSPHGTDLILPCDGSKGIYAYDSCGSKGSGIVIEKDGAVGGIVGFSIFTKPMINLELYVQDLSKSTISNNVISEYVKTRINGLEAYEIHFSTSGLTRLYIQNSKHVFMFSYYDNNAEVAKTILSTFKFTK